ncbi:MAG: ribosome maturation factor RimM [Rhodobacteraceae bacterium]|nr:ribosome maturation factor RimM [Paracoccaceae bacterium]
MAKAPRETPGRVCLGVIVGAKGLRGEVRIKSFTADPAGLAAYGPVATEDGAQRFKLKVVGSAKGVVIARIDGVKDRTAAEALKGLELFVERSALPDTGEGEYYHADLIGLAVEKVDADGGVPERVGTVTQVMNFGGGDILDVALAAGGTEMVPFSADAIAEVDLDAGVIKVNALPGLFGGPDDEKTDETSDEQQDEGDDDTSNDASTQDRHL